MTKRIRFHFVLHDHQPYGNFPEVFDRAFRDAYGPTLELLDRHPEVRFGLHLTGALWEWIESHRPEAIDRIASMAERGQLELIGGPFYEPVLALIPREDALGQIELMRHYIRRRFGQQPRGVWLAERVWQPDLPEILAAGGAEYSFVDDTHLFTSGIDIEQPTEHVITESRGARIALFPIDYRLRYTIPFEAPEQTIDRLRELAERGRRSVTYADDGEKLGFWPGTAEWVWQQRWFEKFLDALEAADDVITALPGRTIESCSPSGLAYPPTTSYDELGEWALPPRRQRQRREVIEILRSRPTLEDPRPLVRGGHFSAFLARYPEANLLHKWMLGVSHRVAGAESSAGRPLPSARRALYRAQVNCPYWHGLFGGLYMPVLRHVVAIELMRAEERLARAGWPPAENPTVEDIDCDGRDDAWGGGGPGRFLITSRWGGGLAQWCRWDQPQAALDVMARWREAYHDQSETEQTSPETEEDGPRSIHDRHAAIPRELLRRAGWDEAPRVSAVEVFPVPGSDIEDWMLRPRESGRVLVPAEVSLVGPGQLHIAPTDGVGRWSRDVAFEADGTGLRFVHRVRGAEPWAVEWNLALPGQGSILCGEEVLLSLDGSWVEPVSREAAERLTVYSANPGQRIDFSLDRPVHLDLHLVETILRSESGYEGVIQGVCLRFRPPVESGELGISVRLARP